MRQTMRQTMRTARRSPAVVALAVLGVASLAWLALRNLDGPLDVLLASIASAAIFALLALSATRVVDRKRRQADDGLESQPELRAMMKRNLKATQLLTQALTDQTRSIEEHRRLSIDHVQHVITAVTAYVEQSVSRTDQELIADQEIAANTDTFEA